MELQDQASFYRQKCEEQALEIQILKEDKELQRPVFIAYGLVALAGWAGFMLSVFVEWGCSK